MDSDGLGFRWTRDSLSDYFTSLFKGSFTGLLLCLTLRTFRFKPADFIRVHLQRLRASRGRMIGLPGVLGLVGGKEVASRRRGLPRETWYR